MAGLLPDQSHAQSHLSYLERPNTLSMDANIQ